LPKTDRIYGTGDVVCTETRVFITFFSGRMTAAADVAGDVYRARLGDFRRPRIGASAGAALFESAPAVMRAAVVAERGRRSCVVPRRVLHEVVCSFSLIMRDC